MEHSAEQRLLLPRVDDLLSGFSDEVLAATFNRATKELRENQARFFAGQSCEPHEWLVAKLAAARFCTVELERRGKLGLLDSDFVAEIWRRTQHYETE